MNKLLCVIICSLFLWTGCKNRKEASVINEVHMDGISALCPYLTKDNKGNTVLCWTEQGQDSLYRLRYAVFDVKEGKFAAPVTVPVSVGCSTAAESMGKIAFKSDGTVIAIFAKRFVNEKNPFAGAIYYSSSSDLGRTWLPAQFIHSDTAHTYGRSFFDVVNLKDGEIAAVWLDGRFGKTIKGSALMFTRTNKGKGFAPDRCVDKGTCECCRTDLYRDEKGNIHLAYRSIQFPSPLSGKQVRDMVYKTSTDEGKTFSASKPISNDNWQIDGCPHSGPTLAMSDDALNVVWFTAGGGAGLYYSSFQEGKKNFSTRKLITATGRHPQMIGLESGKSLMVCEEIAEMDNHEPKMDHSKGGMSMRHGPAGSAKIVLRVLDKGNIAQTINLTDGTATDNHAVLASTAKNNIVAWVREHAGVSKIYYANVEVEDK